MATKKTKADRVADSPIQPMDVERAVEVDGMPGVFVDGNPSQARVIDKEGNERVAPVVEVTSQEGEENG